MPNSIIFLVELFLNIVSWQFYETEIIIVFGNRLRKVTLRQGNICEKFVTALQLL